MKEAKTADNPAAKRPVRRQWKTGAPGPVIGLEWRKLALTNGCVLVARFADGSEKTVQSPDGLTPSV